MQKLTVLANNATGSGNTALGNFAGDANIIGSNNTLIGYNSDVTTSNLTNATAIGASATVSQSNSLILGQVGTSVGIGTTAPGATLDVSGQAIIGTNGTVLNAMIRGTFVDDLPSIAAGATIVRSYAVANTLTTASVYVSPTTGLLAGIVIGYARVSVAGTVQVSFTNTTGGALDQTSQSYYITVIQ